MPMDSQGRHRPSAQLARRADQMHSMRQAPTPGRAPGGDKDAMPGEEKDSVGSVTVHDHGDGTMHSEHSDGSRVEHPDVTHMAAHLMAHHMPGDKHMAMSHDGMKMTAHHADEDGEIQGPHEGDMGTMQNKMAEVMDGDGHGRPPMNDEEDGYGDDIEYGV